MTLSVLIIGGGVAGLTAALGLHRLGLHPIVYEAHTSPRDATVGAAVGLASNGLASLALVSEGAVEQIYASGHKAATFEMRDSDGNYLGHFPAGREGRNGKYGTIMVRRSAVHEALLAELEKAGMEIYYEKRAVEVKEDEDVVYVRFKDGSEGHADFLIDADGVRSVVRDCIAPESLVTYSGLVGVGGFFPKSSFDVSFQEKYFSSHQPAEKSNGAVMVFGPLGFFGFAPADHSSTDDDGSWIWWSTFEADEKDIQDWRNFNREIAMEKVRKRHDNWQSPVPEVLTHAKAESVLPNYDLEGLNNWCSSRIALVGDAAHVMPPHSGQGMSQALEDAVSLTLALRDVAKSSENVPPGKLEIEKALNAYFTSRKPRVNKILDIARRNGDEKREKTPWQCFARKWFMRFFLALCPESMFDWQYKCPYDPSLLS